MPVRRYLLVVSLLVAGLIPGAPARPQEAPPRAEQQVPRPQQAPVQGDEAAAAGRDGLLALLPAGSVRHHSVMLDGKPLTYRVEASTLSLRDGQGKPTAAIFSVAYMSEPSDSRRPITFVFNGGPGAAATYLHLGAIGPRILATSDEGDVLPPPPRLVDNPDTWLAWTDLVFVDPVGTGYSRAADAAKESDFWGVEQDISALSAFIRLYLQKEGRRLSPVYLVGESYGGFRVALLSRRLQGDSGIVPSGLVLISPALEFSLLYGEDYDPLRWALALPSIAAVHLSEEGVEGRDALAARLAPVERYALGDYLTALASGREAGGRKASGEVAELTGLPLDVVSRNFARIPTSLFLKSYSRGEVRSRYDGTITAPDPRPQSNSWEGPDPGLDRVGAALTAAFVSYIRDEVGYRTDVTYRILNGDVNRRWDYGTSASRQGYAGSTEELQEARSLSPSMRVLIVHGFTDLATPYLAARFLIDQLPPLPRAEPIRLSVYAGGHMMYLRPDSRHALARDAAMLYAPAPAKGTGEPASAGPTLP
jgi:carboxypeptidase C (cathepsin A)